MSELRALVGVFAAVDQRVLANPSLEGSVASLVCPYQYGAKGWSRALEDWMSANGWGTLPNLDESLHELAAIPMAGRAAARRLLAIAALGRVTDGFSSPSVRQAAAAALRSPAIAPTIRQAISLVDVMVSLRIAPHASNWAALLTAAGADGLISPNLATQTQPPCAAQVMNIPGNPNPVCTLETNFCTDQLTLDQAEDFLNPQNWPGCSTFWCDMTPLPGAPQNKQRYLETVSLDCNDPAQRIHTVLDFYPVQLPPGQGAIVSYARCSDQSQGGDGLVTVDVGGIEVFPGPNGQVCVFTTKRVQFSQPFAAGELAMVLCALGYGASGEELVFACAMTTGKAHHQFTGSAPPKGGGKSGSTQRTGPRQTTTTVAGIIGEGVKAVGDCLSECASAARCTQAQLQAGTYGSANAAQDLNMAAARVARDFSVAARLSARTLRTAGAGTVKSNTGKPKEAENQ